MQIDQPAVADIGFEQLGLDHIRKVQERIAPYAKPTPIVAMSASGLNLKAENLHPTGAFKMRGAFNALLSLSPAQKRNGVAAPSSGNHAQAVSYAARVLGIKAVVVMPADVSPAKLEATERWGAEIVLVDTLTMELAEKCAQVAAERGCTIVEPFDSAAAIAGAATIGLEILAERPGTRSVVVPVSGGGLIAGIAAAIHQLDCSVRIIGAEPELAADAHQSLKEKRIVAWTREQTGRTIADGLRIPSLGKRPWEYIRRYVHEIVTVSDIDIRNAMRRIAVEARLIAEPSGAVAAAAAAKLQIDSAETVAILSGGNVEMSQYAALIG